MLMLFLLLLISESEITGRMGIVRDRSEVPLLINLELHWDINVNLGWLNSFYLSEFERCQCCINWIKFDKPWNYLFKRKSSLDSLHTSQKLSQKAPIECGSIKGSVTHMSGSNQVLNTSLKPFQPPWQCYFIQSILVLINVVEFVSLMRRLVVKWSVVVNFYLNRYTNCGRI